ncbi:tRNA (adenine-N1)-methyltransferase [Candidatus Woesearchaeota archaeon]|nr:MAG: tRNA (adenine-N1)-methyltransferase [Candidatus Woesearchaeota archaeon]
MNTIKRILLTNKGKKFYVRDLSQDMHTQHGFVKKTLLKKKKGLVKTNTGETMSIFEPRFIDAYNKIKRGAQIIPLKDIGIIVAETGINSRSKVVDAGAGSGALACFLANIVKSVVTYELRDDFAKIVKKNIDFLGLKNIKVKKKSIYDGISEKNIDLITLDLPEPWLAIEPAAQSLKAGGFLVSYSPTTPQVSDFVSAVKKNKSFVYLKTIEIIEREWEFSDRKIRPKSQPIGHSGFLSFARKV